MYAKLADLEIPGRLIESLLGGNDGMVYIKGHAVRQEDMAHVSKELARLKFGDVVTFEASGPSGTNMNGVGEIVSIGVNEILQNFHKILDFKISLKLK